MSTSWMARSFTTPTSPTQGSLLLTRVERARMTSQSATFDKLFRLQDCWVKSLDKSYSQVEAGTLGNLEEFLRISHSIRHGLLAEQVLSLFHDLNRTPMWLFGRANGPLRCLPFQEAPMDHHTIQHETSYPHLTRPNHRYSRLPLMRPYRVPRSARCKITGLKYII